MPVSKAVFFYFIHVLYMCYNHYLVHQPHMLRSSTLNLQLSLPKPRSDHHDAAVVWCKDTPEHTQTQTQTQTLDRHVTGKKKKTAFLQMSLMAHDRPHPRHRTCNRGYASRGYSCQVSTHDRRRTAGNAAAVTDCPSKTSMID